MNRKIGVILSYVMMIFEVLSTLLLTPFILRTLGQAEYGVYKLSAAIVSYLLLLDLGVGNAVTKYAAQYRVAGDLDQSRRFLGVTTIYYAIIALIVVIAGGVLIAIFPTAFAVGLSSEEVSLGQELLSITVINAAVTLGTAGYANVIVGYEKFAVSKGWSIGQIIVRIILTYVSLKLGMGSVGIVSVNLLMTVLCRGFFVLYVLFGLKVKPLFSGIKLSFLKEIVGYSSLILLQMIATQINAFIGQVLLGILVPAASVIIAVYGIGTQIVTYFQSIGSSFTGVLMPGVVKLVESKATPDQLCDEMIRIGRMVFMILGFIWCCFIFYGKQFISLWVGNDNLDAYYVALILMFAYIFTLSESIGTQVLWAQNAHKEQSFLKLGIVIVNIVITIFLIKLDPLLGATLGTFISLILGDVLVMNVVFHKKIGISLKQYYFGLFKGILPCLLIASVAGGLFSLLHLSGWLGFLGNIIVMIAVYALCMFLFGFSTYEKGLIKSIFAKIFGRRKHNDTLH